MDILDSEIEQRDILANKYNNAFASDSRYVCPYIKESNESAWAQYTLLVDDRDSFQLKLKERNIPTAVHYPMPLNKQPAVSDFNAQLPNGNKLSERVVSLPMHAYMSDNILENIIETILS